MPRGYSGDQVDAIKQQAQFEHEAGLNALRGEMQTALNTSNADKSRLREELQKLTQEAATTTMEFDPSSAQAVFIKSIRAR